METSRHLSSESFSYGWLSNIKSLSDNLGDSLRFSDDAGSFIEMDPKLISMRWKSDDRDFDFGLPSSHPPVLVSAEQIFSGGSLLPLYVPAPVDARGLEASSSGSGLSRSFSVGSPESLLSRSRRHRLLYVHATPARTASPGFSPLLRSAQSTPMPSFSSRNSKHKMAKSSKGILFKYLRFLLKCLNLSSKRSARIHTDSAETSPRSGNEYRTMLDMRSESIKDAVLYCKNSIGRSQ